MTVASTVSKVSYAGNGSTTAFSVPFYFLATSHLKVIVRSAAGTESLKVLSTDYTVTGAGNSAGGTVTMTVAPIAGETLVIARNVPLTQAVDYQTNDPFPAETHERALDQLTMEVQQLQEQIDRAIKLSATNTMNSTEFTVGAAIRANKVLAFDSNGELSVTQELGTYRGNWAASTVYRQRDIIKDTSNNNIYLCLVAHTSTGAQPISSNADVAKWALLVDAAAAASSASAAATSASAAATSATNASTSASNASTSASTATTQASNASTSATNAASSASAAASSASAAATSATNASNSASAAANSAAAAAAAAASGLYSMVIDKNANYTVVAADAGDLIRVDTSGGARTITLPQISTVSDGFKVAIVKWTGDTNQVTIARSGSDTINGATSVNLAAQYNSTTFVADFETNQWFAAASGLGSTNVVVDRFNGTGSQTVYTLSGQPGSINNTYVFVSGVYQQKNTYSLSGSTLTFTQAPPAATGNIEVVWTQPLAVGVPSDGTVSTSKLIDGSVTTAKIADANVTPAKLANSGYELGMRNRIINGAMMIDQRNAGAAFGTSINGYTLDRWAVNTSISGKVNGGQNYNSVTPPAGFTNYLGVQSQSAYSVAVGDYFAISQSVEGFNFADLMWGTANAQAVTLSFRVYSSLTGTFGGSLRNGATNRSYPFTYTVSAANTWTTITVTIPGDTTGTWVGATNGVGVTVNFGLGVGTTYSGTAGAWGGANYLSATGAVSVVGTNAATFYITGVQLEKGSTATPFEVRQYGTELALCQRYYESQTFSIQQYAAAGIAVLSQASWATPKRATPTLTVVTTPTYTNSSGFNAAAVGTNAWYGAVTVTATGAGTATNAVVSGSAEL